MPPIEGAPIEGASHLQGGCQPFTGEGIDVDRFLRSVAEEPSAGKGDLYFLSHLKTVGGLFLIASFKAGKINP